MRKGKNVGRTGVLVSSSTDLDEVNAAVFRDPFHVVESVLFLFGVRKKKSADAAFSVEY